MKRGRRSSNLQNQEAVDLIKSTYLLDSVLKQNLVLYAHSIGKEQSDVVREAITQYLQSKKIDPTKKPSLTFASI